MLTKTNEFRVNTTEIDSVFIEHLDGHIVRKKDTILDKELITTLVDNFLNKNKPVIVKFLPKYKITFSFNNKELSLYLAWKHFKVDGQTYKMKKNIEKYFKDRDLLNQL